MNPVAKCDRSERSRNLLFLGHPKLWPVWPFLPLGRRQPDQEVECGLLYDLFHVTGQTGFSATVFLCNLFLLPEDRAQFLTLPKVVYDNIEEIYHAGWRID